MGYAVEKKSQIHSEIGLLLPRLKSFATALTGSQPLTETLLKATRNHILARAAKERGHMPMALWSFMQMYHIWESRIRAVQADRAPHADPRLFQPRSVPAGSGGAGRTARLIAQLAPQQRGALHLVYGERLSYDEAAEVFGVPLSALMTRLVKCHLALTQADDRRGGSADMPPPARGDRETPSQGRGWAA